MTEKEFRAILIETFIIKSDLKQKVYSNTLQTFKLLKKVLKLLEKEYISLTKDKVSAMSLPVFRDKGPFEVEFQIGGDLLIFSMHSNVFDFDKDNIILQSPYIKADPARSYCGLINIYNFLADSFKYDREKDLGYLVARIFINKDNHFFVEGKRQHEENVKSFAVDTISPGVLRQIIENAISYCISFDLLVPPYDQVKLATVEMMLEKIVHSKMVTGKRLGFVFNSDDV